MDTKAMFSGKKPNCELCGYRFVLPGNFEVMDVIGKYSNLMMDGMGSPSIIAIEKILDIEGYKGDEREHLRGKIIHYLFSAVKERQEEYLTDGKNSEHTSTSRRYPSANRNK